MEKAIQKRSTALKNINILAVDFVWHKNKKLFSDYATNGPFGVELPYCNRCGHKMVLCTVFAYHLNAKSLTNSLSSIYR